MFNENAREQLRIGVNILADAVKVTMGPKGRFVLIDKGYDLHITKDGVSVAREVDIADPIQNMGAQLVKNVASKTAEQTGDGTTSATVLTQALVNAGLENVRAGANLMDIKRGIDLAVKFVINEITNVAVNVDDKLVEVATISANNDLETGQLIVDTINKVTTDGVITIEEASGVETTVKIIEGVQVESGYLSPYFITDETNMRVVLEDCYVLTLDKKISSIKDVLPFLEEIAKNNKSVLIIADDIDSDSLSTLTLNKTSGMLKVAVIKSPDFGEHRVDTIGDIRELTGSVKNNDVYIGSCNKVIVTKTNTTIIGGRGNVVNRIQTIKEQMLNPEFEYKNDFNSKRLAKLVGGVAVIYVGAASEIEMKEKKDRFDDALHATRAAIEEGIIPGGGVAYIYAIKKLEGFIHENKDMNRGIQIVREALEKPLYQIALNACVEDVVETVKDKNKHIESIIDYIGFNAKTDTYENLYKAGIIDPVKVVRIALENAASIATMILTTDCILSEKINKLS